MKNLVVLLLCAFKIVTSSEEFNSLFQSQLTGKNSNEERILRSLVYIRCDNVNIQTGFYSDIMGKVCVYFTDIVNTTMPLTVSNIHNPSVNIELYQYQPPLLVLKLRTTFQSGRAPANFLSTVTEVSPNQQALIAGWRKNNQPIILKAVVKCKINIQIHVPSKYFVEKNWLGKRVKRSRNDPKYYEVGIYTLSY